MPLVLTRKPNESIHIGEDVVVTALICRTGKVQLSVDAPLDIRVRRSELLQSPRAGRMPASVVDVRKKMMALAREWSCHTANGLDVLASSCLDDLQELICEVRP